MRLLTPLSDFRNKFFELNKYLFLTTIKCAILLGFALQSCASHTKDNIVYEAQKTDLKIDNIDGVKRVSGKNCFTLDNHFVWCGSVVKAEDKKYYLFYSAMESGENNPPFVDAWLLGSKIGLAVSDSPYGKFQDLGIYYNKDGYAKDTSSWDAQMAHNTHIKEFNGKYYLYYCGSVDPGETAVGAENLNKRTRIQQNQKIGVLCFESIDDFRKGKYSCNDVPLLSPRTRVKPDNILEPSPAGTKALPDNIIVVNPSVVYRPSDGKYLLYFKGNMYDPGWRGVHGVAIGDTPAGPFIPLDKPIFHFETENNEKLSAEDPYVWYHKGDKRFYAVFKDFTGKFTKGKPGLAIMYSEDGIDWKLPENSLFMKKEIILANGDTITVDRLERPQILTDADGNPIVLYAACSIDNINPKKDGSSFSIQIPIKTIR